MLEEKGIPYRYREYTEEPLSEKEIKETLAVLGVKPREVLRRNDRAFREEGLSGTEPDSLLIQKMAEHPTLLQRPIGVLGNKAAIGRPPERLLDLLQDGR